MVDSADSYLLVGSYGVGVHCVRYDDSGALALVSTLDIADPSFVVYDEARGVVTAVVEQAPEGRVASALFAVGSGGGDITDKISSGGSEPCHLALHPDGKTLFVANYGSGSVAVYPVDASGRVTVAEPVQLIQHSGSGPRVDRQEGPHAHMVALSPSGRFVLCVDLGTDAVYVYAYDGDAGRLSLHGTVELPGGSGPRHLAFHSSGRYFYLLNELAWTVAVCLWDEATGTASVGASAPTRAEADVASNERCWPAAVRVSADDRFLYVSNRIDDTIAVFSIVDGGAGVARVEVVPCGGSWPRDIVLSPDGRLLFSANQLSDSITVFRVDADSGRLTAVGEPFAVPAPSSLLPIAGS